MNNENPFDLNLAEITAMLKSIEERYEPNLFALYKKGESFKIFRLIESARIEFVELWAGSISHLHQESSVFHFLTPAVLRLGGIDPRTLQGVYTDILVAAGSSIPVPAYVLHSVYPVADGQDNTVSFLIWNQRERDRSESEYTIDSIFPWSTRHSSEAAP